MKCQSVTRHKAGCIVNDASDWAKKIMNSLLYSLELFQRVITVSLKTMKTPNEVLFEELQAIALAS